MAKKLYIITTGLSKRTVTTITFKSMTSWRLVETEEEALGSVVKFLNTDFPDWAIDSMIANPMPDKHIIAAYKELTDHGMETQTDGPVQEVSVAEGR